MDMSQLVDVVAQSVSVILFAGYGLHALLSESMATEFKRYGLARFRVLTGILQVMGSLGIVVGHLYHPVLLLAAAGLTVLMTLGVITRLRINDPLIAALPAFSLGLLNAYIFASAL